jgi:hypothetical protein
MFGIGLSTFGSLRESHIENANISREEIEHIGMPSFNSLVEFIFSIVELLTNCSARETENSGVATDLMPVRLQFHSSEGRCGFRLSSNRESVPLRGGSGWCHLKVVREAGFIVHGLRAFVRGYDLGLASRLVIVFRNSAQRLLWHAFCRRPDIRELTGEDLTFIFRSKGDIHMANFLLRGLSTLFGY